MSDSEHHTTDHDEQAEISPSPTPVPVESEVCGPGGVEAEHNTDPIKDQSTIEPEQAEPSHQTEADPTAELDKEEGKSYSARLGSQSELNLIVS